MASKGDRLQGRHWAEPRRSYTQWVLEPNDSHDLVGSRRRGSLPVQMHLHRVIEAWPDPPTPDYVLTDVAAGRYSEHVWELAVRPSRSWASAAKEGESRG